MSLKNFFFTRNKKGNKSPAKKGKSDREIAVSRLSQSIGMSKGHIDAIYVPVLDRANGLLKKAAREDVIAALSNSLVDLLKYRRGIQIPSGIDADHVERYREIASYSLFLSVTTKVLSYYLVRTSVQYESHGEVMDFNPLFSFIYDKEESTFLGHSRSDNNLMAPKVENSFAVMVLYDLLLHSPTGLRWFGSYPDMLQLVLLTVSGKEKSLFGEVAERFATNTINSEATGNSKPSVSEAISSELPRSSSSNVPPPLFAKKTRKPSATQGERFSMESGKEAEKAGTDVRDQPEESQMMPESLSSLLENLKKNSNTEEVCNANQNSQESDPISFYFQAIEGAIGEIAKVEMGSDLLGLIPATLHRQCIADRFGHLPKEARKATEEGLIKELNSLAYGAVDNRGRIRFRTDTAGTKWVALDISKLQSKSGATVFDGLDVNRNLKLVLD